MTREITTTEIVIKVRCAQHRSRIMSKLQKIKATLVEIVNMSEPGPVVSIKTPCECSYDIQFRDPDLAAVYADRVRR